MLDIIAMMYHNADTVNHETGDAMKKALVGLALAAAVSTPAYAQSEWTNLQIGLAVTGAALHMADWAQTRNMVEANANGANYVERGLIPRALIGEKPTRGQVDAYMVGSAAVTLAIAHFLPGDVRTAFLTGYGIGKLAIVVNNRSIGLSISGAF